MFFDVEQNTMKTTAILIAAATADAEPATRRLGGGGGDCPNCCDKNEILRQHLDITAALLPELKVGSDPPSLLLGSANAWIRNVKGLCGFDLIEFAPKWKPVYVGKFCKASASESTQATPVTNIESCNEMCRGGTDTYSDHHPWFSFQEDVICLCTKHCSGTDSSASIPDVKVYHTK